MFPSLGILQHYIKFDICTIITLKKLFGVKLFGDSISHLTHRKPFFQFFFLSDFNLPFVVWIITFTFWDVGH